MNKLINPDDDEVISKILTNLGSVFGRVKMDEIVEHFDTFNEMKYSSGEDLEKFLLKFETSVASLKALDCPMDEKIISLVLLRALNVDSNQKEVLLLI